MIKEGNRDNCYYNDFCYRVANHDIPFNLMISNLTYIVHGLILVVWVLMLETQVNVRCKSGRDAKEATAVRKRVCVFLGFDFPGIVVRPLPPLSRQVHNSVRFGLRVYRDWFNYAIVV